MSESNPSKIAGGLAQKVTDSGLEGAKVDAEEKLPLYVRAEPGQVEDVKDAIEDHRIDIRSEDAGYIGVDVPAKKVLNLANEKSVRHLQERSAPKAHAVADKYISEGIEVMNTDTLQNEGITGDGARIAIIDHTFHTGNPKYADQIIATIGPDSQFTSDSEYDGTSKQHGTACAEIVADIAPDAELILASALGPRTPSELFDAIETYDPDGATMSLGYSTSLRIDGEDPISSRIDEFTDGGRLFANSAGNEADGGHWDGQFENNGENLLVFDTSLSTPTRYPVQMDPMYTPAEIHIHWDADWAQDNQRYEARLYETEDATDPIITQQTYDPIEIVSLSPSQHGGGGLSTYYLEIEKINATGDEHFDMFYWGRAFFDGPTTASRSIGIPATSPDENLLAVAAVQATSTGITDKENLKPYSSRGPTQDGRRGIDIAGPSMVSTTAVGEYGGYGALEDDGGFNGTSAASPHIGGAIGLLFGDQVNASVATAREKLTVSGHSISDSAVVDPSEFNTRIGWGYLDAEAAAFTKDRRWRYETNHWVSSSPTVVNGTAYAGSADEKVYAIDTETGSQEWEFDAGARVFSSPTVVGGNVYVGAGHWSTTTSDSAQVEESAGDGPEGATNIEQQTTQESSAETMVYALDADTGDKQWGFSTGGIVQSSPTVYDGTVYVGSFDNHLYALDTATGNKEWEFSTDGEVRSSPTVANGTVYIGSNDNSIYAIDAASGEKNWEVPTGGRVGSSPTVVNGTAYVGSSDNYLYSIDAANGDVLWRFETSGMIWSSSTVANGTVYFQSSDGYVYAVDATNGDLVWSFNIGVGGESSPTVAGGTVYVGGADNKIYGLDVTDGSIVWEAVTYDVLVSAPTVVDGTLYVGSADNALYAVRIDGNDLSDGSRVELGSLGHNRIWANAAVSRSPSVSASGASITRGGQADITVSAHDVEQIVFEKLWTDWKIVSENPGDGSPDSQLSQEGRYELTWPEPIDSASPSITVELPDPPYVGGTYEVTITGTSSDTSVTDTALIQIK
ncbi:PQQ-binding-like beta-propeller repeat protein [Halosimplex rubrum]|uniref:PQQ-binding-like beta-propeller repeat protein n=1 Tax=Halosimplex rubrum TaxID=869889 RepID=A0A7D5SPQ1_9EURY|nr:PQQ-binding-like beta-propeller repeat protein [Halosimplex rubrum]QLH76927.1 PQQ-binding-like beta-propeller repeat protein [Halosimplex rubrum]